MLQLFLQFLLMAPLIAAGNDFLRHPGRILHVRQKFRQSKGKTTGAADAGLRCLLRLADDACIHVQNPSVFSIDLVLLYHRTASGTMTQSAGCRKEKSPRSVRFGGGCLLCYSLPSGRLRRYSLMLRPAMAPSDTALEICRMPPMQSPAANRPGTLV